MTRILLILALALFAPQVRAQPLGPPVSIICASTAVTGTLSTGTTQVIAGTAATHINVCGYYVEGIGAGTLQLVFGTGATCTSPTNITVNFVTSATSTNAERSTYVYTSGALGQSLCAVATGAGSVAAVSVSYTQF